MGDCYCLPEITPRTDLSDVVKQWRYLATLDGRTCMACGSYDDSLFKLDEAKPVLPMHWNCRCTYVPVTNTYRELGVNMDEATEGSRPTVKHAERWVNHRDGTRSRKFTPDKGTTSFTGSYQAWLKEQVKEDPAFVKSILGPKRFDLFRAGKLTLNSMITNGRIKLLDAL